MYSTSEVQEKTEKIKWFQDYWSVQSQTFYKTFILKFHECIYISAKLKIGFLFFFFLSYKGVILQWRFWSFSDYFTFIFLLKQDSTYIFAMLFHWIEILCEGQMALEKFVQ